MHLSGAAGLACASLVFARRYARNGGGHRPRVASLAVGHGNTGCLAHGKGAPTRLASVRRCAEGAEPSSSEAAFLLQALRENRDLPILHRVEEAKVMKLVQAMVEVTVSPGDVIAQQGARTDSMFIVSSGQLAVSRETHDGPKSPAIICATRGDYVGASVMLGNTPQADTVTARTKATLWRLDRSAFDDVVIKGSIEAEDEDDEEDVEDEEDGEDCVECEVSEIRNIFIVSDSTGESATATVRTALQQFEYCFGTTCGVSRSTVYRFVRTPLEAERIAALADEEDALLVHTVMDTKVHEALVSACAKRGVECCDLWEALLTSLESKFGAKRSGVSVRKQPVTEDYMHIVNAVEYTRRVDDGVSPRLWDEADLMLVGPSRAGKTPLAFYLAQHGFKVANYPLVPDEEPPPELFTMDQSKVFALFIEPGRLQAIRKERMLKLGRANSSYADIKEVKKEANWIRMFYMRRNWPIIDTSESGVAESSARILEILDRRKGDSLAASSTTTAYRDAMALS